MWDGEPRNFDYKIVYKGRTTDPSDVEKQSSFYEYYHFDTYTFFIFYDPYIVVGYHWIIENWCMAPARRKRSGFRKFSKIYENFTLQSPPRRSDINFYCNSGQYQRSQFLKNALIFEKRGGADAFENNPSFISKAKGTVLRPSAAGSARSWPRSHYPMNSWKSGKNFC